MRPQLPAPVPHHTQDHQHPDTRAPGSKRHLPTGADTVAGEALGVAATTKTNPLRRKPRHSAETGERRTFCPVAQRCLPCPAQHVQQPGVRCGPLSIGGSPQFRPTVRAPEAGKWVLDPMVVAPPPRQAEQAPEGGR